MCYITVLQSKVKNCSKIQALRAILPFMFRMTATGQIICDITVGGNVYEGPKVLVRDHDLKMLVKGQTKQSLQQRHLLLQLLTRVYTLYTISSLRNDFLAGPIVIGHDRTVLN